MSRPLTANGYPVPLARFVEQVELLRSIHADGRALAQAVSMRLRNLVRDPTWLPPAQSQPAEDHYRQHVLHVAPDGGFSVVALVWKPGQATPVHDHVSWCVVGVYQGAERETRYRLYQGHGDQFLVEVGSDILGQGETTALVPPDEDIHHVACAGTDVAISIHVYGADIGKLGTSINRRFDHLEVRDTPGSAQAVSWRDSSVAEAVDRMAA